MGFAQEQITAARAFGAIRECGSEDLLENIEREMSKTELKNVKKETFLSLPFTALRPCLFFLPPPLFFSLPVCPKIPPPPSPHFSLSSFRRRRWERPPSPSSPPKGISPLSLFLCGSLRCWGGGEGGWGFPREERPPAARRPPTHPPRGLRSISRDRASQRRAVFFSRGGKAPGAWVLCCLKKEVWCLGGPFQRQEKEDS